MTRLAADLLVLARADEGGSRRTPQRIRLAELATDLVAALPAREAGESPRETPIDVPADLELERRPDRLRQALTNLIENAVLHGGEQVSVAARTVGPDRDPRGRRRPGVPRGANGRETERFARGRRVPLAARVRPRAGDRRSDRDAHGGSVRIGDGQGPRGGADVALILPAATSAGS